MEKKQWKKLLYADQNVEDNYVDETFLDEMKKNVYVRRYRYWDVVMKTISIANQLSSVVVIILIWWILADNVISTHILFAAVTLASLVCYLVNLLFMEFSFSLIVDDFKKAIVVLTITDFLSPILKTLTNTIDTDTIYAMSFFMIVGHLAFNHYGASFAVISRAMSLNMAVFSAICLASRLQSDRHVFVYIISSLVLFGLWPHFYFEIKREITKQREVLLCLCIVLLTFISISCVISLKIALLFFVLLCCVCFICPAILINLQRQKDNIHGPWDEAVISSQLRRRLSS